MSRLGFLLAALAGAAVHAQEAPAPTVVLYDAGNTIPVAPYLRHIAVAEHKRNQALASAQAQMAEASTGSVEPVSLAAFFPIRSERLQPGPPTRRRVAQLPIPIFVIGMDSVSLQWFEASINELRALGAQGVVVQAENFAEYDALRRQALSRGVVLDVTPGDAIAEGFDIKSYPTLLVGE